MPAPVTSRISNSCHDPASCTNEMTLEGIGQDKALQARAWNISDDKAITAVLQGVEQSRKRLCYRQVESVAPSQPVAYIGMCGKR